MSRTIARFSSFVVRSASATWRTSDLATRQTTGASESSSARTWASSPTFTPALRVAPKATSWALRSFSSPAAARAKNSVSLGIAPGQPPSMKPTPNSSSNRATASLSLTEYEMPSRCAPSRSVVSKTWNASRSVPMPVVPPTRNPLAARRRGSARCVCRQTSARLPMMIADAVTGEIVPCPPTRRETPPPPPPRPRPRPAPAESPEGAGISGPFRRIAQGAEILRGWGAGVGAWSADAVDPVERVRRPAGLDVLDRADRRDDRRGAAREHLGDLA